METELGQQRSGDAAGQAVAAPPSLVLAVVLLATGVAAAAAGSQIELSGFTDPSDPGPRLVPVCAGIVLSVGGVVEIFRCRVARRGGSEDGGTWVGAMFPVLAMALGITAYVVALPFLGFGVSTAVFTFSMVWVLGGRWWAGLITAVGTVGVVSLLFVGLFKVQLPAGVLGLPF